MWPEARPAGSETRERLDATGPIPVLTHHEWATEFPGLVAGITCRSSGASGSDFGLAAAHSAWEVTQRYEALARQLGFSTTVVARQVHGARVVIVDPPSCGGVLVPGAADGLATGRTGVLLAVTVADCVPIYLTAASRPVCALLHAGWRGTASGVLESAVLALEETFAVRRDALHVHLGPAICGRCYEVGAEVLRAFDRAGAGKGRLDLRWALTDRALSLGIPAERVSRSALCTRCGNAPLYSHRGGPPPGGRMAAYLGWQEV